MRSIDKMKVRDVETQHPESIEPDTSVTKAAQIMRRMDIGALPVCEGQKVIGLVTDRDITVRAVATGRDPRQTPVREIMSPNPVCCHEDQDLAECVDVMEQRQIRRLPVLDSTRQLVGIVSLSDLALRSQNERLAGQVLYGVSAQRLTASAKHEPKRDAAPVDLAAPPRK